MTERVADRLVEGRIIAVAAVDPFAVFAAENIVAEIADTGYILFAQRKALRQFPGGTDLSVKNAFQRFSAAAAAEVGHHDPLDLIRPGHFDRRAALQHDCHVFADLTDPFDELVLICRQAHVFAVVALGFLPFRQADKNDSFLAGFCSEDRLFAQQRIFRIQKQMIALRIAVRHFIFFERIKQTVVIRTVYFAGTGPLKTRMLRQGADHSDLFLFIERQHALVFQQDDTAFRQFFRKGIVFLFIVVRRFLFGALLHQLQHSGTA